MNTCVKRLQPYQLPLFFVLSLGSGWLLTLALRSLPASPLLLPLLALPISFAPAGVAWLLVRSVGKPAEQRAFRQRLTHWRVGWRWLCATLVALPLIHLVGVGLALAWGGRFPFHPTMLALLLLFFPLNLGEEIGWRGYALPKLQEHFAPFTASLILGAGWGAFHLFALLANPTHPWLYLLVGGTLLLAMSVIMTQLFNRTKESVLLMALAHAMYDTVSIAVAPLIETGAPLLAFALSAGVAWLVAAALLAQGRAPGLNQQTHPVHTSAQAEESSPGKDNAR